MCGFCLRSASSASRRASLFPTITCRSLTDVRRRKTDYLRRAAQILHDKHDDDVPKTIDELLELPGVGPKVRRRSLRPSLMFPQMGFLALLECWDLQHGIGVDTHGACRFHSPADRVSPPPQQSTAVARQVADQHRRADAHQPRELVAEGVARDDVRAELRWVVTNSSQQQDARRLRARSVATIGDVTR